MLSCLSCGKYAMPDFDRNLAFEQASSASNPAGINEGKYWEIDEGTQLKLKCQQWNLTRNGEPKGKLSVLFLPCFTLTQIQVHFAIAYYPTP